jgi:hypothetical protein
LQYKSLEYCKKAYPYFENATGELSTTEDEVKCIKSILSFIKELTDEFIGRNYIIYSLKEKKQVHFDELLKPIFLFFSVKLLNKETLYIVTNDSVCIDGYDELLWIKNEKDGIVVSNDEDGQCLYFYLNDECKKHEWIVEYLKPYNVCIYNDKQGEKLSMLKRIAIIILAVLVALMTVIIAILKAPFLLVALFKKPKP